VAAWPLLPDEPGEPGRGQGRPRRPAGGLLAAVTVALSVVGADLGLETARALASDLMPGARHGPAADAQFNAELRARMARRTPLRDLQHWIRAHPAADLSVPALASRGGLSPRQFTRVFAAETGVTPGQYVDQVRLEAACRLLVDTEHGLEQIARACGYGTPETMRRAFVRRLGIAPGRYRRRVILDRSAS